MRPFENDNTIYWAKCLPDAIIPKYDKFAYTLVGTLRKDFVIVKPHSFAKIGTGILAACSDNNYILIKGSKELSDYGIIAIEDEIESSSEQEIEVTVFNTNNKPVVFTLFNEVYVDDKIKAMASYKNITDYIIFPLATPLACAFIIPIYATFSRHISLEALQQIPQAKDNNNFM